MSQESVNRKVVLTAGTRSEGVPRIIISTEIEGEISGGGLSISLTPEQAFLYAKRLKKVAKKLINHTVDLASYYEEKTLYDSKEKS
jgi:hypothetical protein